MTLEAIFKLIQRDGGAWVLVVMFVMSIVQIAPIKIDPWSELFSWIGGQISKPFRSTLDEYDTRLKRIESTLESDKVDSARKEIISIGSKILQDKPVEKEELRRGADKCNWYEKYIEEHKITNGVADISMDAIRKACAARGIDYEEN